MMCFSLLQVDSLANLAKEGQYVFLTAETDESQLFLAGHKSNSL